LGCDCLENNHTIISPDQESLKIKQRQQSLRLYITAAYLDKSFIMYSNGRKTAAEKYKNGIVMEWWKHYTFDGNLFAHGGYKNGVKEDLWIESF
jgi:antitoxin component YwqK of YwqJK toxin-antitoxin module